ncbi:glutamate racemase [bacterium]|nr:MAG: glutamate racemase [bacterium]
MKKIGKIGIFDSGLGGLTILKEVVKLMPYYEYIYLGDNKNTPYGDKTQNEIFKLTLAGVEWLFKNGSEIVILACNTSSANALSRIQQEILPIKYPDKKVLGIIIPTIEEIEKFSKSGHIGVLATKATVKSEIYEFEMQKYNSQIKIISQAGGNLANLIELNSNKSELLEEIKRVTSELIAKNDLIDTVILGCTHYALIAKEITQVLPKDIHIISQGEIIAVKLIDYLKRHTEIDSKLNNLFSLNVYTTSSSKHIQQLMTYFYGENIRVWFA